MPKYKFRRQTLSVFFLFGFFLLDGGDRVFTESSWNQDNALQAAEVINKVEHVSFGHRDDRRPKDKKKTSKQSGGQQGHKGSWLKPSHYPGQVQDLNFDRRTLHCGKYKNAGHVGRQLIEIKIHKTVKEHWAEILHYQSGNRFIAPFPAGVTSPA